MRTVLLILAVITFAWAAILGFGLIDDPSLTEDYAGWLALGLCLAILAELPIDDLRRRP